MIVQAPLTECTFHKKYKYIEKQPFRKKVPYESALKLCKN